MTGNYSSLLVHKGETRALISPPQFSEMQRRLEVQRETRSFIDEYIKEREEWRKQEASRLEKENEQIEQYAKQQQERQQELKDKKKLNEQEKNIVYERLASEVEKKEREREEFSNIRLELLLEEEEERARQRDRVKITIRTLIKIVFFCFVILTYPFSLFFCRSSNC